MEATKADPTVPAYWSNMAASHEKLGNWAEMADAGRNCVKADSKFVKGYFRLATAMKNLKNMAECIKTLESGLGVDSSNSDLKKMKKEVVEMQVSFLFVLSLNSTPYSLTHSPPPSSPFSFPFSPTTQHNTTQHNTTQHNTTHNTTHSETISPVTFAPRHRSRCRTVTLLLRSRLLRLLARLMLATRRFRI